MAVRKPVPKDRFLLWMLAIVFGFQASLFAFGFWRCSTYDEDQIAKICPEIGRRYDQTFGVMVVTILALLTASKTTNTP